MELIEEILDGVRAGAARNKAELQKLKMRAVRARNAAHIPSDAELLAALPADERADYVGLLRTKPTRTLSGVAIVTVQASPDWCPHGTCTFCPGGPPSQSAKSYTGFEPAAQRAGRHGHDPHAQVKDRLEQLQAIGHDTDKIDLIVQGGTFPARDEAYQQWFVQRCYDAMNLSDAGSLGEAMRTNETAPNRCIGLTIETKPDWCLEPHLDLMLEYGTTRVEIGVQTTFDDVLERTHRGHTMADTVRATRLAKDAGLKLVYHLMPGLPGNSPERDIETVRRVFDDPDLRPDMLKIYPTLVVPGTQLYEEWRRGEFTPYTTQQAAEVVAETKRLVPPWVRIQRVDRDIPTPLIQAGVDKSNLREIALDLLRRRTGRGCRCIRCREVGFREHKDNVVAEPDRAVLVRHEYEASGGREVFLAFEDPQADAIFAFLRLRRPGAPHRPELQADHAMIRELKVHGRLVPIGQRNGDASQHQGFGRRLIDEAARVTGEEWGLRPLFVISGVGVKEYYRRLGFEDRGAYLARNVPA